MHHFVCSFSFPLLPEHNFCFSHLLLQLGDDSNLSPPLDFSVSAVDQSGSVGSGQPLVNAIRTDSALIGGTKPFLSFTLLESLLPLFTFCFFNCFQIRKSIFYILYFSVFDQTACKTFGINLDFQMRVKKCARHDFI